MKDNLIELRIWTFLDKTRANERNAHTIGPSGDDAPHVLSSSDTVVENAIHKKMSIERFCQLFEIRTVVSRLSQTFDLSENDLQTPKVFDLNGCLT